jgi:hypothetical protein
MDINIRKSAKIFIAIVTCMNFACTKNNIEESFYEIEMVRNETGIHENGKKMVKLLDIPLLVKIVGMNVLLS